MVIVKWVKALHLGIRWSIMILACGVAHAKNNRISLQEAIEMALKENLDIRIASNTRRRAVLSNRLSTVRIWAPKAEFMMAQENKWGKETQNFYFRSEPVFKLTWELGSLFDNFFRTKVHRQKNIVCNLVAAKSVEKELKQVVTRYYELALAQKKWDLSNTFIKTAGARLKVETEKYRLGSVDKIDYLNAELTLKREKLTLLEHQETLKEKRRGLNLVLGKPLNEIVLVEVAISAQPIWDITAITKEKVVDLETAIQEKKVAIAATELASVKAYLFACLSVSGTIASNGYAYDFKKKEWDTQQPGAFLGIGMSLDIGKLLLLPAAIKEARIALDNEKFLLAKGKLGAEGNLEDRRWKYRHAIGLHKVGEEQLKISKQKLVLEKERYRLNKVKLLDLQEAEEAVRKAEINLMEYAFKVKQAEFDLYQLVGMFY